MSLHSAIEPFAENLLGWSLDNAAFLIRGCPQISRDGERLRPFHAGFIHRKGLTNVTLFPRIVDDGFVLLVLYGPRRRWAQSLLMEAEAHRPRLVTKDWSKYCRAYICVRFSARSPRPDFIVMESVAHAATPRARRELLERRYNYRVDLAEWDAMLATDFAHTAKQFRQAREEAVASIISAAAALREIGSRPLP